MSEELGTTQPSNASSIPIVQPLFYDTVNSAWQTAIVSSGDGLITHDVVATEQITGGATTHQSIADDEDHLVARNIIARLDNPENLAEVNYVAVDRQGHLKVDVISGGISVAALSTHAKQDTIIGHLDGVEGKLDNINSKLDDVKNKLESLKTKIDLTNTKLTKLTNLNSTQTLIKTLLQSAFSSS